MVLFLVLLSLTMIVTFYWLFSILQQPTSKVKQRVKRLKKDFHTYTEEQNSQKQQKSIRDLLQKLSWWTNVSKHLRKELRQANIRMKAHEFFLLILVVCFGGFTIGYSLTASMDRSLILSISSSFLPFLVLRIKKKRRKNQLESQLGEMLNITSNSLKAGYSIIQALEVLSREMTGPLAEEIQRLVHEMQLGVPMEEALGHLNERVQSKDLDLIITAILIQRQVGGNLAKILDNISNTIRERVRMKGQIQALTAQGRMSGYIFMLLPPGLGLFIYVINPSYILLLFQEPIGLVLLTTSLIGQIIGALFIKKIVRIDV